MMHPERKRQNGLGRLLKRRGMALLLVMIGMVVCTILTAGFLSTQGTSIGIARNERDAARCRGIAQTGADMCYWLIRNKSDWRETMSPGTWLSNVPIGEGTVSVTVEREYLSIKATSAGTFSLYDSNGSPYVALGSVVNQTTVVGSISSSPLVAGVRGTIAAILVNTGQSVGVNQTLFMVKPELAGNFSDDPAQAVTVTSTGTFDNRRFTLTATIRPTGGGTVFRNGNFISGNMLVGNGDLVTPATVDSYNSSVAAYNALSPGSNASYVSNAVNNNGLLVYFPSVFRGSYTAGPSGVIGNIVGLVGPEPGPSATGTALESRNPGTVVFPNTAGLVVRGVLSKLTSGTLPNGSPGVYDSVTVTTGTINLTASGIYCVTGNVSIGSTASSTLSINDGVSAVIIVKGNLSINAGRITLGGTTSQLALYVQGNVTLANGSINNGGGTSRMTLYGGSSGGQIQITNTGGILYGSIYAPQHDVTLSSNSPKVFGAVVAQSLTIKNFGAVHFDEALRSLRISNITGGSAAPGSADYRMTITGGPGI